ncbi:IS21 family transposase [Kitasatospora sp. GAS204B]|uniref:Mu transposase domain-containing protein n=1 Tax=unclassified Kitasatospora TaxID=2633591 RepID=UPI0024755E7A|nr:IS21 family transposase [Kitasatospora sp. GAS204B]
MDDPHLLATTLFEEIVELGYTGGYSTFTRALRKQQARPVCGECQETGPTGSGPAAARSSEQAIRFDWLELPTPPAGWGCGNQVHLLLGLLTPSGRWRGALAADEELPQLVEAMEHVLRRLGGTPECWRFDRTPAVHSPSTGQLTPDFRQVARYYGVRVEYRPRDDRPSPAYDTVEEIARNWWHAIGRDSTVQAAQDSLDRLASRLEAPGSTADGAPAADDPRAATQGLRALPPAPFPIWIHARRTVDAQGLVPFEGNFYAVPEHLVGAVVEVRRRLDEPYLSIAATAGAVIARYALAPAGAGSVVVERSGVVVVLERHPTPVQPDVPACRQLTPRPLSEQALAEADALRGSAEHPSSDGRPADSASPDPPSDHPPPDHPTVCRQRAAPGSTTGRVPPQRER